MSYDYGEVLYKSILFYEAQRSGWLPDDRRVWWRGHSALEDKGVFGEDLSGGWYDDKPYSDLLLRHAKELFDFADRYRGLYSDTLPIVQEFYRSGGYKDELSWAAAWLYRATGDNRYLQKAEENHESYECWAVSWEEKHCLAA
nr:hypothetical protein BaRGS_017095 [Batillaria attramentaria]